MTGRQVGEPRRVRIGRRTPVLTIALIAVTLAMFAVEFFMGALNNTAMLVTLGAKEVVSITQGEWWRLITPIFLHGSFQHIIFNMLSLWIWGRYAELMQGRVRYAVVYFLSGIAGNVLSYALSTSVSVGASGAVFGLFGSFLYLRFFNKEIFNRVFGTQVVVLVIANLAMSVFSPGIDLWGHAGGLVGGFLAAAACGLYGSHTITKWRVLGAVGFIALFGGLFVYGYMKYSAILAGMG